MNKQISAYKNGWLRVLLFVIPYLIIVGVFQMGGMFLMGENFDQPSATLSLGQNLVVTIFDVAGVGLVVWLFRRYVDKESFLSLGFHTRYLRQDIGLGLLLGLVIMASGMASLLVTHQISFKDFSLDISDLLTSLLLFIGVAISEELLCRGYMLNNLMKSMNKYVALGISSLIFSLMHAYNPNVNKFSLLVLFLAGVLLGLSYLFTKNLWFPIALHFSWNFFQGPIFGFNVSGQNFYSMISQSRTSDSIWNGGAFGFEGSVLCVILQLAAIFLVYKIYSRRKPAGPVQAGDLANDSSSTLITEKTQVTA